MMEAAGEIRRLVVHPVFYLHADGGEVIGRYSADFAYLSNRIPAGADPETFDPSAEIVEDVKSKRTAATAQFRRTLRHMQVEHGITVQIVLA